MATEITDILLDEEKEEDLLTELDTSLQVQGQLNPRYQLQFDNKIEELSTEFAIACSVFDSQNIESSDSIYALVFREKFPLRIKAIEKLKKSDSVHITDVIDSGKIALSKTGAQRYAVIFKRPEGKKLSVLLAEKGSFDDVFVLNTFLKQMLAGIESLHDIGIIHGCINPDTIYIDRDSGNIFIKECFSHFCGYLQKPIFESTERLMCHKTGKGDWDFSCDYYALGVVLLSMLTGRQLFEELKEKEILEARFERGSIEMIMNYLRNKLNMDFPPRILNLFKALLNDFSADRWRGEEISIWIKKQDIAAPVSKIHKQAPVALVFNEKEYFSRQHLAHDIFVNWAIAKNSLKIADLARWLNLGMKKPEIADQIDSLVSNKHSEAIIPDEKIMYIITILDPSGPIRYKEFSSHIFGMGSYMWDCYMRGERDLLQNQASAISEGFIDYWVRQQPDPDYYSYSTLSWSPGKLRQYIRKRELGFGLERCIYELNGSLPCQSKIMGNNYVTSLPDLLTVLDHAAAKYSEGDDMVDRHIAAYIASSINLMDEIRIKELQSFPDIGKNPQMLMLGFLALAQSESRTKNLKALSTWISGKLIEIIDSLHSKLIKRDVKNKIKQAAKEGNLNSLFKVVSASGYIKRDYYGFQEARKQYRLLTMEILELRKQSSIERMAYKVGLRISVSISYIVCVVTVLFVLFYAS